MRKLKYTKLVILVYALFLVFGGFLYHLGIQEALGDFKQGLGVIAFNTDKSIFTVGEEAYMQLAVLDERGQTLCSAKLTMEIISPLGTKTSFETWDGIDEKPQHIISDSGECKAENITDLPDYFAFMRLEEIGEYKVTVIANTKNSRHSITDKFEVRQSVPFDIRRTGPTRIYPFANYAMRAIIEVHEDFQGTIEEQVPASFKLLDVELKQLTKENKEPIITESTITSRGDTQIISSEVSWKAGERYKLTYIFDAPDVSPEFYLLGPLVIGDFQEIRQWQIASDAVTNNGVLNYGRQTDTGLNYVTTFTSGSLDTEYSDVDTSASAIQFFKSVSAPAREEKFAAHQKADGQLDVLTCTTDCNAIGDWTKRATFTGMTATGNSDERAFDIAYEQLSGKAMIVFGDDPTTNTVYWCRWDGASWEPSTPCGATFVPDTDNDIVFTDTGVPRWVRLVAYGDRLTDVRSDEMLLAVSGDSGFELAHSNGADSPTDPWEDITSVSTTPLASTARSAFDVAWEAGGDGLAIFDITADDGTTYYRKWNASSGTWDGSDGTGPDTGTATNNWIELAHDPMSDRISMIVANTDHDVHLYMWRENGSTEGFTVSSPNPIDSMVEDINGKMVATAWSRFNSNAIFSYTDFNDLDQDVVCYTTAGGIGSVNADRGGQASDDVDVVIYIGSPNSAEVFYLKGDVVEDLTAGTWDGAGCASGDFTDLTVSTTVADNLSVTAEHVSPIEFWYSYDPYSPWSLNWRFYDDETVDNPTDGLNGAAENATPTSVDQEELIRLRMNFAERGGEAQTDTRKKLQFTSGCNPNTDETACSWTDVGDVTETSAVWRYASQANGDSVCSSCNDNTTITNGLTDSDQNGTYITDKDAAGLGNMDHNSLAIVEYDYPLKAENVVSSTTYYFRAWDNGQQSRVYREQDDDGNNDCASATCTYPSLTTSSGVVISVVVEDGVVTYGTLGSGASKNTLSGDLNDQQDAANTGGTTEDFNIMGQNSGCPWTLSDTAGTDNYVHEFSTNTGTDWFALTTTYQELAPGITQDATQSFDLQLTVPTTSSCFDQQSVDVTVQAVQG